MRNASGGRERMGPIRILVAGGDSGFAEAANDAFSAAHDVQITHERSPETALEALAEANVDCCVNVVDSASSDALEFLRAVERLDGGLPVLVVTDDGEVATEALESGVSNDLLTLAIDDSSDTADARLANHVETLVDRSRLREDYERLLEHAPEAIATVAGDGTILAANGRLAEQVCRDQDSLVGTPISDVFPDGVGDRCLAVGRQVIDSGEPEHFEESYDGQSFENVFVPAGSDSRGAFQFISRDVTERRECERERERHRKRLERVASAVSHELRNPLNVAQSFTELLDDEYDDAYIGRIERALSTIDETIDDAVALARETDAVTDPSPVDFERVVESAWAEVDAEDVALQADADGHIEADAERLEALLYNLLVNAVEHAEGVETVTVGPTDGGFYVADDGAGIPDDHRDEVFDTGFSTGRGGTGLGLTLVREIASAHGWSVELSESDTGGARFDVVGVDSA